MAFAQKLGKGVCQIEHMIQPRRASTRISVAHRVRLNVSAFTDAQTQTSSTLAVKLSVPFKADFGQNLKVVGNISTLGGWEVDQAPEMTWSEGDVWMATLDLPEDASVEFKLVLCRPNAAPEWEASPNRTLTLPAHATAPMDISLAWGYPEAAVIVAPEATLAAAESVTLPFESAASVLVDSVAQPEPEMVITYEEPVVEAADLLVEAEGVGGISEETAEEEPVAEPKTNFLQVSSSSR